MKKKLAKFAVFQVYESGADELYKSRDNTGRPLMTYREAVHMKEYLLNHAPANNNLNLIVRSV